MGFAESERAEVTFGFAATIDAETRRSESVAIAVAPAVAFEIALQFALQFARVDAQLLAPVAAAAQSHSAR